MNIPRVHALVAALAASTLALAACGGDDGAADTTTAPPAETTEAASTTPTAASTTVATTAAPVGDDAARNASVLVYVCEEEILGGEKFPGNPAYDAAAAGPHPVTLAEFHPVNKAYLGTIRELPDWVVRDTEYDQDNPAAATVQLVGCLMQVSSTGRGVDCEFPTNDGGTRTLALADGTYQLQLRSAQTRDVVGAVSLVATSDGCPATAEFSGDDTEYVNVLTDDQIIAALAPFVGV